MESFFFLGIGLVIGLVIGVLVMRFVVVSKTLENKSKQFDEIRQIKEDAEKTHICCAPLVPEYRCHDSGTRGCGVLQCRESDGYGR